jgi:glycogen synthase
MKAQDELFDYLFQTRMAGWTPLTAQHHQFFSEEECALLERSNRSFKVEKRTVVQLTFENRFASLGGLAAVIKQFPQELKKQGEKVVVLTPLHRNNQVVNKAIKTGALVERFADISVSVCNFTGKVSCFEEVDASIPTYHIAVAGRFIAGDNPYGYDTPDELLEDALAFCAVVPSVCARLDLTTHLLFHAHDWECAGIALFSRFAVISSILEQVRTVLTLHNSFDASFPEKYQLKYMGKKIPVYTVLQCMLSLIHGPLTTVSTPFAHELRSDPLQCSVFADHLQEQFTRNPPVGIENGMFIKPEKVFSEKALDAASGGEMSLLLEEKRRKREKFFSIVSSHRKDGAIGMFSAEAADLSVPVLFMSGRFDLAQKGFDVIFNAFSRFPKGTLNLFFTPTLHNDDDDLSFFSEVAQTFEGHVVIWPFKITEREYMQCLRGASFLVMPSFYEPFGAASEGFLNGTPLFARATGGLLAQVKPDKSFTVPERYSSILGDDEKGLPNGILYREACDEQQAQRHWRPLLEMPPAERAENPLYCAMVDAAHKALQEAVACCNDTGRYAAMIYEGLFSVRRFTWSRAAVKYRKMYDAASYRGN